MSYLEKLLEGVEVEWKTLSEVATIGTGSRNTNESIVGGKYPFFVRSQKPRAINDYEFDETAIITAGDGVGVGKVFHYVTGKYSLHQRAYRIVVSDNCIISKYLFHFIRNNFAKYLEMTSVHASVTSLRKPMFEKYPIPIPPISVQKEIVRILDTFTELTAELTAKLTAELTARKQQYSYYREQLLSLEEGEVEWKSLGEVCKFTYGYAAKAQDNGDARFVRITDINVDGKLIPSNAKFVDVSKDNERYILKKYDILMARTGATYGKTMIFEEDYTAIYAGFLIKLSFDREMINPKYYWHFAQSDLFWFQANKLVSGGGQPQFNANALKGIKIPVPFPNNPDKSLEEQERIVSILDKFDTLTNSISEGLPKEIELRKKQYEYYRDMLLTFPQLESV